MPWKCCHLTCCLDHGRLPQPRVRCWTTTKARDPRHLCRDSESGWRVGALHCKSAPCRCHPRSQRTLPGLKLELRQRIVSKTFFHNPNTMDDDKEVADCSCWKLEQARVVDLEVVKTKLNDFILEDFVTHSRITAQAVTWNIKLLTNSSFVTCIQ